METTRLGGSGVDENQSEKRLCGLVMPISATDGCTSDHWSEVKTIISDAVSMIGEPKFSVRLVSDADDVGVIQKRIVQNLYSADIVICDVSGKNPNVMFELGMRLAFDKPTIIVKDDKTDYSFDTGIIEHLTYPRDLRFSRIVSFKAQVVDKIQATLKAASDPSHSTFLKNFGTFQVAKLSQDSVPADRVVIEMLSELQNDVARLRRILPRELERSRSVDEGDGLLRVMKAVGDYFAHNPKKPIDELMGDATFKEAIEQACIAPKYFRSGKDFSRALQLALEAQL